MPAVRVSSCFRYHKGTDFQANHNLNDRVTLKLVVVLDTTKVQIFKQITTSAATNGAATWLFQIPQRYRFSSKSQLGGAINPARVSCFRYHKGTDFQANHNLFSVIVTISLLFQIPQRYRFSSKSQHYIDCLFSLYGCFRYHKGTDFQANHNRFACTGFACSVVLDTTKVQIFKQITTTFSDEDDDNGCFRYHKGTDFQANHNYV